MPVQKSCEAHSFKFSSLTSSSLSIYITQIQHFKVQQTYVPAVQAGCILRVLLVFPRVVSEPLLLKSQELFLFQPKFVLYSLDCMPLSFSLMFLLAMLQENNYTSSPYVSLDLINCNFAPAPSVSSNTGEQNGSPFSFGIFFLILCAKKLTRSLENASRGTS